MTQMYATPAELRGHIDMETTTEDGRLEEIVSAASAAIDRLCNRPLGFLATMAASTKVYPGSSKPYQLIDECVSITLVEVKDSITDDDYVEWAATDWTACTGDYNYPDFNSLPYTMLVCTPNGDYSVFTSGRYSDRWQAPTVRVTARWGYAEETPDQIKTAAIMQSARWFKRLQSAMADTLATGELGQLIYTQELDPDIAMILKRGRFIHPATGRW